MSTPTLRQREGGFLRKFVFLGSKNAEKQGKIQKNEKKVHFFAKKFGQYKKKL